MKRGSAVPSEDEAEDAEGGAGEETVLVGSVGLGVTTEEMLMR